MLLSPAEAKITKQKVMVKMTLSETEEILAVPGSGNSRSWSYKACEEDHENMDFRNIKRQMIK